MQWKSVKDGLPPLGYLCIISNGSFVKVGKWDGADWITKNNHAISHPKHKITHWVLVEEIELPKKELHVF